jgi:3-hydroxyacyl-CoA dehydrogenase
VSFKINKVAVLGSGTMGSQIAAHCVNAGFDVLLLDIVPRELTPQEAAQGLTLESKQVRNRIVNAGLDSAKKIRPAAFFSSKPAGTIESGNFDDDLGGFPRSAGSSKQSLRSLS